MMTEGEEATKEEEVTAEEALTDVYLDEDTAATEEDDVGDVGDMLAEGTARNGLKSADDSLSAMPKNLDGLDMREIHRMVREIREQKRELDHERKTILNMKRAIIFLCAFTLALTLAMLGVSFVAARLARDTTVTGAHALADKASGETLSTISTSRMYHIHLLEPLDEDEEIPENEHNEIENKTEDKGPGGEDKIPENEQNENENRTEDSGHGGGRRRLFTKPFSNSRIIGREMWRRMVIEKRKEKKKEQQQGRKLPKLYRQHGARGSNRNRNNRYYDGNRNRRYSKFSDYETEETYVGVIYYSDYESMRLGVMSGDSTTTLVYEDNGLYYQDTVSYSSVYMDRNSQVMAFETQMEFDCYGRSNCDISQSLYVIDNCHWTWDRRLRRSNYAKRGNRGYSNRYSSRYSNRYYSTYYDADEYYVCDVYKIEFTAGSDSSSSSQDWYDS